MTVGQSNAAHPNAADDDEVDDWDPEVKEAGHPKQDDPIWRRELQPSAAPPSSVASGSTLETLTRPQLMTLLGVGRGSGRGSSATAPPPGA